MKKLIIISSCIVLMCFIVSFGVLPTIKSHSNESIPESQSSSSSSLSYVVKDFNGNIAVFENGKNSPFKITDVPINSLPYADREILRKGIAVTSKSELNRILEDYCS